MVTRLSESELPIGGAGLGVDEYLEFLRKEYLADFIRRGGASVKLAVAGSDQVAERFHTGLAAAATAEGYVFAAVDAASVRVHLVDQIFFAVARQVDWGALAASAVRAAYDATAFPVPDAAVLAAATPGQAAPGPSDSLTVDAVATAYGVNPGSCTAVCAASSSRQCSAAPAWRTSSGWRCSDCAKPNWAPVMSTWSSVTPCSAGCAGSVCRCRRCAQRSSTPGSAGTTPARCWRASPGGCRPSGLPVWWSVSTW